MVQGGFQQEMTRREAALILGLRESAAADRIKEAHRRIMTANHPDQGTRTWCASMPSALLSLTKHIAMSSDVFPDPQHLVPLLHVHVHHNERYSLSCVTYGA